MADMKNILIHRKCEKIIRLLSLLLMVLLCSWEFSCERDSKSPLPNETPPTPVYTYQVINEFPHSQDAFTQGLIYADHILYESTGLYGQSSLRKIELESGQVLQAIYLENNYFGEGITLFQDRIIQLTWQSHRGFVYDKDSLELLEEFTYPGEGWGITHDGSNLIMSDGTSYLRFLDPVNFSEIKRIEVTDSGVPVRRLNELEFVEGEIFANIWLTNRIARISPTSGKVLGWIELQDLLTPSECPLSIDVLNGIAYDPAEKRLFVTGKFWCKLFEIQLIKK